MKVLVTGSAGYIGRGVVQRLVALGHEVVGIDDDPRDAPHTEYSNICELGREPLECVTSVIHLCGVSLAPDRSDFDAVIWQANEEGTRVVLERAEQANVQRFVLASSASVFEGIGTESAGLDMHLFPLSPYGRSKAGAERMLRGSTIPKRIALRKGTIVGVGTDPHPDIMRWDLVIHNMTASAIRNKTIMVSGDGSMNRPILSWKRAVKLYSEAATAELPDGSYIYNLTDVNVTLMEIAREVQAQTQAVLGQPVDIEPMPQTGRPRDYYMPNEHTSGLDLQGDTQSGRLADLVSEIVALYRKDNSIFDRLPKNPLADRRAKMTEKLARSASI